MSRPLKVVEITNTDFALVQFLLPLMRAIRTRGHEVLGAAADGELLAEVRAEGFPVAVLPFVRRVAPLRQIRAFVALLRLFRAERPDLVHAHMPISGFLARLAARAAGVPRIAYTCHGFLFNQPGLWPRRAAGLAMEWLAGRVTDVFLTVSEAEAADARHLGIARHAVAVGNGRDPARFRPDRAARAALRRNLGVPEELFVVVFVGRLVQEKGIPELLAAMRSVTEAELWLIGERLPSDRGPDMDALIAQSELGQRVRRLGQRHDVPALLAAGDVFCLPSHNEGLPMSVIEAMLCALPVVASALPGIAEQVAEGETGFLVPPGEVAALAAALRRLAADPGLRAAVGRAGRERAIALFDESRVIARTLDLLAVPVCAPAGFAGGAR